MTGLWSWRLGVPIVIGLSGSVIATDSGQKPIVDSFTKKNPFDDAFAKFANMTLDKWKVPGLSIAVIDDEDIYAEGYGFATLPDTAATPETLWYGASTTKAFTAATLAHLIDTKEYASLAHGWNTPISSIIRDDFVLQDEWATNHITLEDAVSHRTGMPRHDMTSLRSVNGRPAVPRDIVRNLRNLPTTAEPRVKFQYCNLMFVTLSHVIETITGKWLGDVLKENIWSPLGMDSTYLDLDEALAAPNHLARGYYWDEENEKYNEVRYMPVTEVSGAGAIFSNVLDYAKWVKSLLHKTGPLSESVYEDIRKPRFISGTPSYGRDVPLYGLAWDRFIYKGHVVYTHDGGMHAFGAEVFWLPEIKYGVVSFANTAVSSNAAEEALVLKLVDEKLGIKEEDRIDPEKKFHDAIDKLTKDLDNALDNTYPNRPETPVAPTTSIDKLAGTYYDPGYKNITLRVKSHAKDSTKQVLTGFRENDTWPISFDLHHVSGDWWIMYLETPQNPTIYFRRYAQAEFKIGVDGAPAALQVQFDQSKAEGQNSNKVLFNKIV
ncbi:D-aminopeptidase [Tolypocladium ophioglossoides CBS 100239]|uniref:D-aminopeptidase n=1 Tax=Tolypocladium ophioglossoides (strain CBS 100239) TaxID=1163406 RepID=A0A0L0MZC4_TOLOC|nr:D-aminopeptidase [Tolypocladium ophioglossoides CBS 100239]